MKPLTIHFLNLYTLNAYLIINFEEKSLKKNLILEMHITDIVNKYSIQYKQKWLLK